MGLEKQTKNAKIKKKKHQEIKSGVVDAWVIE